LCVLTFTSRVKEIVALLHARPEVKQVFDYANTGDASMIAKDGNLTVVWRPSAP